MNVSTAPAPQTRLFSPVVALCMVLVGVFAFSAFFVLQAYAPDLRGGDDGGEHALSKSAVGYAGLVELLKAKGDPVVISRGRIASSKDAPGVLILTPTPRTDPDALAKIRFDGPALIVLPKWMASPDPLRPGWVRKFGALPDDEIVGVLPKGLATGKLDIVRHVGRSRPVLKGGETLFDAATTLPVGPTDEWQTLSSTDLKPVLTDSSGGVVLGLVSPPAQETADDGTTTTPATPPKPATGIKGDIYILSDPDLLDTHGLKDLATARAAVAIVDGLRGGGGPAAIDVTLHGFARGRNILKLAFEPPFLALTLCLAAAAAMMGWHAYARFGPTAVAPRAVAFGKSALVDNSSALIRVARREPHMAPGYVNVVRQLVARLVGAPRELDRAELDALLDRIGHARGAEESITDLAKAAEGLKDDAALMRVAHRLQRWRTEMTRERQ